MKIADLVPDVLVDVPGCPRATVRERVLQGAVQAARDTLVWEVEIDRFMITDALREIDLHPPVQRASIHLLTVVEVDNKPVGHAFADSLLTLNEGHNGLLLVRGALEPDATATDLPAELARWKEAVQDYARFRLLMMPRQEWTNPELGFAFRRQYEDRVNDARVDRARGRSTVPLRVKPQTFI